MIKKKEKLINWQRKLANSGQNFLTLNSVKNILIKYFRQSNKKPK
jgi:hypothetical protein